MYLTKKDRKIQTQQREIERLTEENELLKKQLALYETDSIDKKIMLAEQAYEEYMSLSEELSELKQEYIDLVNEIIEDREKLKRRCR